MLGLDVENTNGGVRVNYVLSNSVADKSKSNLKKGDVITAVNGQKLNKKTNFYSLLKQTQGNEVLLSLNNGKDVVIRPQSSIRKQQYEAWIDSRKKLVDE